MRSKKRKSHKKNQLNPFDFDSEKKIFETRECLTEVVGENDFATKTASQN